MKSTVQAPCAQKESRSDTVSAGKLIKRAEAARMLGVSVSTLRRREGAELTPVVDADGVHMFDESEVRSVMVTVRRRQSVHALGTSIGDVAADVFTMLDAGEHPVEIVKQLRIAPDAVVGLQEQWAAMRGGFAVGPEHAVELQLLARAQTAATSGAVVVMQLRHRIGVLNKMRQGSATCCVCGDQTASICEPCIVVTNGPLGSFGTRVEHRAAADGHDEVRVCADIYWHEAGEGASGAVAELRSEWRNSDSLADADIADLVEGITRIAARG
jgi:hypothetical protein